MKKVLNLLMGISVLLLVQSCSKTFPNLEKNEKQQENEKMLASYNSLNNADAVAAYLALTDDEIKAFWNEHINTFKSTRVLNDNQLNSINSLLLYIQNADLNNETYKRDFLSVWLPNALQVFGEEDVFILAFSVFDTVDDDYIDKFQVIAPGGSHGGGGGGGGGLPPKPCRCEVGSTFWACALHPQQCVKKDCLSSSKGCGFLLLNTCDGVCDLTQG